MLGNHLVGELLCWKVEFFLSLTEHWDISNKQELFWRWSSGPNRATKGSSKTWGSQSNQSPAAEASRLSKHINQEHFHTQLYQNFRVSSEQAQHLPYTMQGNGPSLRSSYLKKMSKTGGQRGGVSAAQGWGRSHSAYSLACCDRSHWDSPCLGSPISTMGAMLHPVLKRQLMFVKHSGNLD